MKLSPLLAAPLLALLCACGHESETGTETAKAKAVTDKAGAAVVASAPQVPMSTPSTAVAILNDYLAAWNAHDANRAGAFLDEDSQYFDAAFAGMQRGRQAIVDNAISVFLRGMPDLHWEIRGEPIASPQGVAYEWTLTGTNTGTWGGVRPTSQKINLKGVSFMRIRGGKIVYQAVVYDSAALNRQLGL